MQIAFVSVLLVILLAPARLDRWNEDYIGIRTTSVINGLFIWLVFMSHFTQYLPEYANNIIGTVMGQLVVVMFLFYSGYGCALQYKLKGGGYLKDFPRKRILVTFVNFAIAVCVFVAVGIVLGKSFALRQILLSILAWDSVGNSNWYIFTILVCYGVFWLAAAFCSRRMIQVSLVILSLMIFVALLSRVKPSWWYDTVMAFGAGVVYGSYRKGVENLIRKHYVCFLIMVVLLFLSIEYFPIIGTRHWIAFNVKSVLFAFIVIILTMKVSLRSDLLQWSGEHLFPLYIYQRIPMIVFSTLHPVAFQDFRCWIYFVLSMAISIAIAFFYPKFQFMPAQYKAK